MTPEQIIKTFLPGQQHMAVEIIEALNDAGYVIASFKDLKISRAPRPVTGKQ